MSVVSILAEIKRQAGSEEHRQENYEPGEFDLSVLLVSGVVLTGKLPQQSHSSFMMLDAPIYPSALLVGGAVHRHYIPHEAISGVIAVWL